MADADLAVVNRLLEAIGEQRYEDAAGVLSEDAEWHNTAGFPGPTVCRGRADIARFWRELFETYAEMPDRRVERVEHADGVVVTEQHGRATGRSSGVPVDIRWAHVFHLRAGEIARVETYGQYERALAAAGLSAPG